jgi:hypothetical protein
MNFSTTKADFSILKNGIDPNLKIICHNETGYYNIAKIVNSMKKISPDAVLKPTKDWFRNNTTKHIIDLTKNRYMLDHAYYELKANTSKLFAGTYLHPSLFYHFMGWLNPLYTTRALHLLYDTMSERTTYNDLKASCVECGNAAAITSYGYKCESCWRKSNPQFDSVARYKEKTVMTQVKKKYPNMILDSRISGGTSLRRPDGYLDRGTHSIIVEIDERQHKQSSYDDDDNRIKDLINDTKKPIVIIRLNPDKYQSNGETIDGAFYYDNDELKSNRDEIKERVGFLIKSINRNLVQIPTKPVTIVKHCFDE